MPHDPALAAETRAWLEKAGEDLAAAAHELGANPPLCGDTAFHAQQAVEKALKAFLTWHGREFRKAHNLDWQGFIVKANVKVGALKHGGWEMAFLRRSLYDRWTARLERAYNVPRSAK